MTELHRRLAAKGKTASWLAREMDVSRGAVSRWLDGTKKPAKKRIPKLAGLFDVPQLEMTYLVWPVRTA